MGKLSQSKVRIDKWLWSVRIYKTRSQAAEACRSGDVKIEGRRIKPSYVVEPENTFEVSKNGFDMIFRVVKVISRRVSAPMAQECYEDLTSEEEMNKYKDWFIGKAKPEIREKGSGRPTKKERREIDEYKDSIQET